MITGDSFIGASNGDQQELLDVAVGANGTILERLTDAYADKYELHLGYDVTALAADDGTKLVTAESDDGDEIEVQCDEVLLATASSIVVKAVLTVALTAARILHGTRRPEPSASFCDPGSLSGDDEKRLREVQ